MIITKFNKYFEKHGKMTYVVLCIIISVIFVCTIGSSDGCFGKDNGITSLGEMYGETLRVSEIARKENQLRLFYAMHGQRLTNNEFATLQMALEKMRLVHYAKENGLAEITKDEFADAVVNLTYWQISDKARTGNELDSDEKGYTPVRFARFIEEVVKGQFGLTGKDFDEMIKEDIMANRVRENAVKDAVVPADKLATIVKNSKLMVATYKLELDKASAPSEEEIKAFTDARTGEIADYDKLKDDEKKAAVVNAILGEKALALYKEKVEKVYADKIAAANSMDALYNTVLRDCGEVDMMNPASTVAFMKEIYILNNMVFPFTKEADGKFDLVPPEKTNKELIAWYKRIVAREALEATMQAKFDVVAEKIKAGKSPKEANAFFLDVDKDVNWSTVINAYTNMVYQQMMMTGKMPDEGLQRIIKKYACDYAGQQMGINAINLPELIIELDKLGDNALVPRIIPTLEGFALVYQVSRTMPKEDDPQLVSAREILLSQVKSQKLSAFMSQLEIESNTRLIPELFPVPEEAAANK